MQQQDKNVTINVNIKELIGSMTIAAGSPKEGSEKVKEAVVAALTSAVNDSRCFLADTTQVGYFKFFKWTIKFFKNGPQRRSN